MQTNAKELETNAKELETKDQEMQTKDQEMESKDKGMESNAGNLPERSGIVPKRHLQVFGYFGICHSGMRDQSGTFDLSFNVLGDPESGTILPGSVTI